MLNLRYMLNLMSTLTLTFVSEKKVLPSFEIGDVTVFTVPLVLDKKWPDFHKHFPLYNVAAMTQIERQCITEALQLAETLACWTDGPW